MPVDLPHHPLLGRRVNHDPRSRAYALRPVAGVELRPVRHEAHIGVLDQGNLGSCTGNAGVATIYREPYVSGVVKPWKYPATEAGAVALYSAATEIDPWPGAYPPEDTGSDGLSVAKVLKNAGIISGYAWAFDLNSALQQLQATPLMTGLVWYYSMFETDSRGHAGHVVVRPDSGVAGGHELCVDEYIPAAGTTPAMVGGPNSWGTSFGDNGRWYLTVDEWRGLLAQDGDVTAMVPVVVIPEPDPVPVVTADDADRELWADPRLKAFAERHCSPYRQARAALRAWADRKGLPR